jgi:hypothetical protein
VRGMREVRKSVESTLLECGGVCVSHSKRMWMGREGRVSGRRGPTF